MIKDTEEMYLARIDALEKENALLKKQLCHIQQGRRKAGRKSVLSVQEKEEIKMRRLQGDTLKQLAEQYDCSIGTVSTIINTDNTTNANKKRKKVTLTLEQKKEICQKRINGSTLRGLAKQYDCSTSTILNIIKKNG